MAEVSPGNTDSNRRLLGEGEEGFPVDPVAPGEGLLPVADGLM